jgi:hypothetical protein
MLSLPGLSSAQIAVTDTRLSLNIGWSDSPMTNPVVSNVNGKSAARLLELIQMRLISEGIYVVASLGIADLLTRTVATSAPTGTTVIEGRPV